LDGVQASGQRDTSLKLQTSDNGSLEGNYFENQCINYSGKVLILNPNLLFMQQFIFFLWITLISVTCSFGQKSADEQKLRQQEKILKGYSAMDNNQKLQACKDITSIWFDTIRYTPKEKISREQYKRNDVFPLAFELTNKNNRYDKKIVYFNSRDGKITKVLDLQKLNPYTKAKNPGLDENMRYLGEMNHIPVTDDQGKRREIEKFISWDMGRWENNHILWCFRKYALTNKEQVIDEWNTFLITDSIGNIIMLKEYNLHSIRYKLNEDASYLIIDVAVEGWEAKGFIITDVKKNKIEYNFKMDNNDVRHLNGAIFSDNNKSIIIASIPFPNNHDDNVTFYEEKIIVNMEKRIEYRYSFTKAEWTEVVQNREHKYKNYEILLNYFDFTQRSF